METFFSFQTGVPCLNLLTHGHQRGRGQSVDGTGFWTHVSGGNGVITKTRVDGAGRASGSGRQPCLSRASDVVPGDDDDGDDGKVERSWQRGSEG